ncbi:hypothetical protein C8R44DRAFT_855758 [Mycena epipterygia]|nr:hypothetical protein C8R44DRAFT_855758 [Mycena epipterygia]
MSLTNDRTRIVGIYPAPAHLSREEFRRQFEALVDELLALPITKKHFLRYDLLFSNTDFDEHMKPLGFRESPGTAVIVVETEKDDHMIEVVEHPEFRQVLAAANINLKFTVGHTFTADLVTKVDK